MKIPETIGLREAAMFLATDPKKGVVKKPNADALLSLLQVGKLTAGIQWTPEPLRWIRLRPKYWAGISVKKLSSLKVGSNEKSKGAYEIRIEDFVDEFIADLESRRVQNGAAILKELRAALSTKRKLFDVRLEKQSWHEYLERRPAQISPPSAVGRPRKDVWREMVEFVGAYYLARRNDQQPIKTTVAGAEIFKAAKAAGIDPPAATTIQEILAKIKERSKSF